MHDVVCEFACAVTMHSSNGRERLSVAAIVVFTKFARVQVPICLPQPIWGYFDMKTHSAVGTCQNMGTFYQFFSFYGTLPSKSLIYRIPICRDSDLFETYRSFSTQKNSTAHKFGIQVAFLLTQDT